MVPVFIESQHLDRDVAGGGVLFQMVEHGPTQHVGKKNIQRYCCGMELPGQRQCLRASHGHQHFESLVVRQINQNARIVRIVFHDQQDRIVRLQVFTVVRDALNREFHRNR